jgi:hypothetical protein
MPHAIGASRIFKTHRFVDVGKEPTASIGSLGAAAQCETPDHYYHREHENNEGPKRPHDKRSYGRNRELIAEDYSLKQGKETVHR